MVVQISPDELRWICNRPKLYGILLDLQTGQISAMQAEKKLRRILYQERG